MELFGDIDFGSGYSSRAQQARRISEEWVTANAYCLRCESNRLSPTRANTKACDFTCENCNHAYELKSKRGTFSVKVLDGAYGTMMRTIREGRTPTFFLLEYSPTWSIVRFRAIHHALITQTTIQPRKPLRPEARRAGWIGCNIVLPAIATQGQIDILSNGLIASKILTRQAFARLEELTKLSPSNRTWAATILRMVASLPAHDFSLADMYGFELELIRLFPKNQHLRPKIRQQLQVLRDAGLIKFGGRGRYQRLGTECDNLLIPSSNAKSGNAKSGGKRSTIYYDRT